MIDPTSEGDIIVYARQKRQTSFATGLEDVSEETEL